MGLPYSKNQVRHLGKRLRDSQSPAPEDLDRLAEVLVAYDVALSEVVERLTGLGLRVSSRLKNTGTIIEKLRRDRSSNLPNIQDLAGVRVFLADTDRRSDQDTAVAGIVAEFADPGPPPRVSDRRATPSQGYRAVHVVVFVGDLPVEIQVRTRAQHEWAEFFERLADLWGREIRYQDGRPEVGQLLSGVDEEQRARWEADLTIVADGAVRVALEAADLIARLEILEDRGAEPAETAALHDELRGFMTRTGADMEELVASVRRLAS